MNNEVNYEVPRGEAKNYMGKLNTGSLLARVPGLRRLLCQHSFLEYCKAVVPDFQAPPHILLLIKKWEAVESGKLRRLLISLPPRHGKTFLWILFIAWALGRHPEWQIAVATYSAELAESWGRKVLALIASETHQAIFPKCRLSSTSVAAHRFETTRGGGARFVGRGGTLLGTGAQLLIADDLYANGEEARSDNIRNSTWDWFIETFFTRQEPAAAAVVIGSRWTVNDVIGRLKAEHASEGWESVDLPALAEVNDPLGRPEGAALWPERFDTEALQAKRRQMGSVPFMNIYQGRPAAAEGVVFKRSWFRTYWHPLPVFQRIIQDWDTAYGKNNSGDYSVCTTWGVAESGFYLLSLWRGRVDFPTLKRQVVQQAEQWKPQAIYIEDSASGQSLIQELRNATTFPVIPVKVDRDKRSRAEAVTAMFEAGRVFFPNDAPWRAELEDELAAFPVAAHDDQVDSVTMALNCLRESVYTNYRPSITTSESRYSISGLRRYYDGAPPHQGISPAVSKKVLDGIPLTDAEEWEILESGMEDLLR